MTAIEATDTPKKPHKGLFLAYLGTSWFINMACLIAVHDHPGSIDGLVGVALALAVLNLIPAIFFEMSYDEAS
jgi:hypothetical protein